ncbi:cell division FtsA domain-containing protein [Oscillibacter sp. 1-3]|uniref:cell division FtsA domain-containing protein n=1 Tax=Oscillibacter sp. 1-3 TaxID=1235797 RepID=UPI00033847DE|nr:cell division FtsA domain-containing protein [Oscillibacter sp. 1-3]EOS65168.1 cell division protein FtsA [Oscillibacter sp. 1-3]
MAEYKAQEQDMIFALDIGTRSIVGVVGRPVGGRLKVLDIEMAEHTSRAMMDGQIDNIQQVAALARTVTDRLEDRLGIRLERVCVAAAGRALRTQSGCFRIDLPQKQAITAEQISRLEAGALSAAEEALQVEEETRRQFFMVGYTVAQYRLDNYPLATLLDHNGQRAEAEVVATFLPGEVVESLYTAMRAAGLQVASLTLEPIAAMNAAVPMELRLLNLALVDIGAGTTDIAVCRDGSVVGYTMATIAGDEITEALMRAFLVDFQTAEEMKRALHTGEDLTYMDILGMENTVPCQEVRTAIEEPLGRLAEAIAQRVTEVNTVAPSALFLAGGGSKLDGLRERVARCLSMDERRVATAGSNYAKSAFADGLDLGNPEYATPLGIAVSAGLGLLNDSYVVTLNGETAKLFRSGSLTLRDILLMNGYTYADMLGRTGKNLSITLDGRRIHLRGEPAVPAILMINGEEAALTAIVNAGDRIAFTPARSGADAFRTLGQLLGEEFTGRVLVNNQNVPLDTPLQQGDVILTLDRGAASEVRLEEAEDAEAAAPPSSLPAPPPPPPAPVETPAPAPAPVKPAEAPRGVHLILNGTPLTLPEKDSGQPYYLMDLLERSGLDFDHLEGPVRLTVNGMESGFSQAVRSGDVVTIRCD